MNARGNVGAYHFDNTVEGGPDGGRVTNPPMWGALGTDGERSGVLRTELANAEFDGTRVVIRDVVHPATDVLARDIEIVNPPEGARLAYYANMNPTTSRAPRTPSITDALVDDGSDFATTYDEGAGAMLHFRPYRLDPAAATVAATSRLDPEIAQAAIERTVGAEPGVLHYGERIFHVARGEYLHGVGFPHIWSGTEVYVAAALVLGAGNCSATDAASGTTCPVVGSAGNTGGER